MKLYSSYQITSPHKLRIRISPTTTPSIRNLKVRTTLLTLRKGRLSQFLASKMSVENQVTAPLEAPVEKSPDTIVEDANCTQDQDRPYSTFSERQKTCISFIASFSAMFSGLSSFIYYPSITAISQSLRVSIELVNLTFTCYQVVSGIAPSILGDQRIKAAVVPCASSHLYSISPPIWASQSRVATQV